MYSKGLGIRNYGGTFKRLFISVKALYIYIFFSNVYFIRNLMFFPSEHKKVQTYTNAISRGCLI